MRSILVSARRIVGYLVSLWRSAWGASSNFGQVLCIYLLLLPQAGPLIGGALNREYIFLENRARIVR